MLIKQRQNGFTLIELLVVISVIGLLASVVLLALIDSRRNTRDTYVKEEAMVLAKAIQAYSGEYGYPAVDFLTNDGALGDNGMDTGGGFVPASYPTSTFQGLLDHGFLNQPIAMPPGRSLPAGQNNFFYMHVIGANVAAASPATRTLNYCSIGAACGFKDPNTTASYCAANSGNNSNGTPAVPAGNAAIFFWLEAGQSSNFAPGSPILPSGGNSICIN